MRWSWAFCNEFTEWKLKETYQQSKRFNFFAKSLIYLNQLNACINCETNTELFELFWPNTVPVKPTGTKLSKTVRPVGKAGKKLSGPITLWKSLIQMKIILMVHFFLFIYIYYTFLVRQNLVQSDRTFHSVGPNVGSDKKFWQLCRYSLKCPWIFTF